MGKKGSKISTSASSRGSTSTIKASSTAKDKDKKQKGNNSNEQHNTPNIPPAKPDSPIPTIDLLKITKKKLAEENAALREQLVEANKLRNQKMAQEISNNSNQDDMHTDTDSVTGTVVPNNLDDALDKAAAQRNKDYENTIKEQKGKSSTLNSYYT